jgi:Flp pilus assembly protein TadD
MYKQLGAVHELLQQLSAAIDAYTEGLALSPDYVALHNMRGWAHVNDKNFELARVDFAEVLRIAPQDAEARTGLGFVLAHMGRDDDARQAASAALLAANDNQLILHNVACIYARLSMAESVRKTECENLALAALDRAMSVSLQRPISPDELTLIQSERWFPQSLKSRPEFERLLSRKKLSH